MNLMTISTLNEFIQSINFEGIGMFFNYIQVFLLGIIALFLSVLSFSGTWLIAVSMIIFKFFDTGDKIGWITIGVYIFVCIAVEVAEFFAAKYGIKKADGSKDSEIIGMLSGIVGAILGEILIPIPFIGSFIGMFGLSFLAVYLSEYASFKKNGKAVKVAWAGVAAKAFMIIFKLLVTAVMFIYFIYRIF